MSGQHATHTPSVQLTRTTAERQRQHREQQAEKGSWLKQVGKVTRVEEVKSDRQGVGGVKKNEEVKKNENDWWEGKKNEQRFKNKTKSRMLISQHHVYDRVWARGHASTG